VFVPRWIFIFDSDQAQINSVGRERSRDGRPLFDVREGGEKGKMGRG
jgi:hypothetical protein